MANGTDLTYVGFWWRVLATILDGVVNWCVFGIVFLLVLNPAGVSLPTEDSNAYAVVWLVAGFLYVMAFWMAFQATPGKLLIGARIVDARTGGKPSLGQFVIRYFGVILSALPLMLGYLWVGFDRRKQGWHDKLARTVVVRARHTEAVRFAPVPQS